MTKELIWLSAMVMLVLGDCVTYSKLNIEQLGNVSRFYRTCQICERNGNIETRYDCAGRLIISYKVNIKRNESDDDLCKCMWQYVNQRCWLTNVEHKCVVNCAQMTMYLIGPPNPNYDPLEPLPPVDAPITTLGDLFKYYPEIEVADHKCYPTTNKTVNGLTCISMECKLTVHSHRFEKVCKNILQNLNQCGWLGTFENSCSTRAGKVIFEMIGK